MAAQLSEDVAEHRIRAGHCAPVFLPDRGYAVGRRVDGFASGCPKGVKVERLGAPQELGRVSLILSGKTSWASEYNLEHALSRFSSLSVTDVQQAVSRVICVPLHAFARLWLTSPTHELQEAFPTAGC